MCLARKGRDGKFDRAAARGLPRACLIFHFPARCQLRHRTLFPEDQVAHAPVPIDAQHVTGSNLPACQEIRQWAHQVTLDCPFQMPGAVSRVGSLIQQKLFSIGSKAKQKLHLGSLQYAHLHLPQLDFQNFLQLFAVQGTEDHKFVQAVQAQLVQKA